ncbi:DUF4249 domain-containing protein [Hymenobacter endophyticus]|uniref:DUF4249 domain-containing protein n=1 Tax=Hymenobacter endophyticus TaxID=3076335 RepID=A0ABU3THE4_9BACT|nr:DUF4249 domain-containing protein [Hymenobacter endophyticus]MDU0370794.1 DUF4249 domain-containing protein [Hymenobacter endophyticus]
MHPRLSILCTAALWVMALLLPGCIESYSPEVLSSPRQFLVVDGFINSQGVTTISLQRTIDITAKTPPPPEKGAAVSIEEENGARYVLPEGVVKGTYSSAPLTLNPQKNYRLRILTATGKEYASAYTAVKTTPPIGDVTWQASDKGLDISLSSYDASGQTRYYRWEYVETWEIASPYNPTVEYKNSRIQDITTPFPTRCWSTATSSDIEIASTVRLTEDRVSNYLLRSLPTTSDRLRIRYSILVSQHAQTAEEYMYWELLRKNTENIGTLFDPLPSQLTGNIRCLNDENELALGFISAHSLAQKRLFIGRGELPRTWLIQSGYESCLPPDTVKLYTGFKSPAEILKATFSIPGYLPINEVDGGYTARSRECIDCRLRGTAVKPDFWP